MGGSILENGSGIKVELLLSGREREIEFKFRNADVDAKNAIAVCAANG